MVKILLIQPYVYHSNIGTIQNWDVPSLGLAYIAAVLRKNKYPVFVIDAYIEQLTLEELDKRVEEINPDVIGITANSFSAIYAINTLKYLRKNKKNRLFVMGGVYPSVSYEILLKNKYCDVVIRGEGEYTLLELVKSLEIQSSWKSVRGISYLEDNTVYNTPNREFIENLDDLPFPAWDLFPTLKKYKNLRGVISRPYVPILTSRGCPFKCIWCSKFVHGYRYRMRSPENVFEEIMYDIKTFHVKEFAIMDDVFNFDEHRIKKLLYLIKKNNIKLRVNFYSGIRADSINESIMRFFTTVKISRITIGIESGNQKVLNSVGKGLNLSKVMNAIELSRRYKIITDGFFIIGHPYDNIQSMEDTIQVALKSKLDHAYFFTPIPYIGTDLYKIVMKGGKFLDPNSWSKSLIVEGRPMFEMPNLPAEIVVEKFKKAYQSFYYRPSKIISLLFVYSKLLVQYHSISEIRWLISQFLYLLPSKHIKSMLKIG